MKQNKKGLESLAAITHELKRSNYALECRLGLFSLGAHTVEATEKALVVDGGEKVNFYPNEYARQAAIRTFGNVVGRELLKTRTEAELRRTLIAFGEKVLP